MGEKFKVTSSDEHDELLPGETYSQAKQRFLDTIGDFKSQFADPNLVQHGDYFVVRDDKLGEGSKLRAAEFMISKLMAEGFDHFVYVQPRFGFAGITLARVCSMYGAKLTLFMPSSKQISDHQAYCIEHGAEPEFRRIAAMPNLNRQAKAWADSKKALFIPLGVKHPYMTAGMVHTACMLPEPEEFWSVCSTMVLNRALQIAWPNADARGVAVARSIQPGEKGRATVYSHYKNFSSRTDKEHMPPFPSAENYDAKAWEFVTLLAKPGAFFWNVASSVTTTLDKSKINSYRPWN